MVTPCGACPTHVDEGALRGVLADPRLFPRTETIARTASSAPAGCSALLQVPDFYVCVTRGNDSLRIGAEGDETEPVLAAACRNQSSITTDADAMRALMHEPCTLDATIYGPESREDRFASREFGCRDAVDRSVHGDGTVVDVVLFDPHDFAAGLDVKNSHTVARCGREQ